MIAGTSQHISMLLSDGRVLVTGGDRGNGGDDTVQVYDPKTNIWSLVGHLPTPVFVHAAQELKDGRIYVAGGFNRDKKFLDEAWIFDLEQHQAVAAPRLTEARDNERFAMLRDGRIFMLGGDSNENGYIKTSEYFDPVAMKNTRGPDFPIGRSMGTATRLNDGTVLVVGGIATEDGKLQYLDAAYVMDPETNTLQAVGRLATARKQDTATLLKNGKVLVIGGVKDDMPLKTIEVYDPETRKFTPGGELLTARYGHTATLLDSGKVLVTGGMGRDDAGNAVFESAAELYDPKTGKTEALPPMHFPRVLHSAVKMQNGNVLMIGGYYRDPQTGTYVYPDKTEIFSAGDMTFR